jgi:hypothetical protein
MKSVFQLVLPITLPRPTDLLTIGVLPLPPIGCRKVQEPAWAVPMLPSTEVASRAVRTGARNIGKRPIEVQNLVRSGASGHLPRHRADGQAVSQRINALAGSASSSIEP